MSNLCDNSVVCYTAGLSLNLKLSALEKTLQQSVFEFQGLAKEVEVLHIESLDYKKQLLTQKEKCESNHCSSSEALTKIIESKDNIIQSVASALTKLNETKNFNIVNQIFKILCGDTTITISNCKDEMDNNSFLTPKKELFDSIINNSMKDESVSEIEGTPTGRTSPIIQSRKSRSGCVTSSSDHREKKKCPNSWPTPDNKAMKLTFPLNSKRGGKWRQSRLNLIKVKPNTVVDLTSSPEVMTVNNNSLNENNVQLLVKKESTDNDDTILPSPTSGPNSYPSLMKNTVKSSPIKFKRPLCLKNKSDNKIDKCNIENSPIKGYVGEIEDAEESINLMKPVRFITKLDENSPIKVEPQDEDETRCEIPSSLSILELADCEGALNPNSPAKRPLGENQNIVNTHDRVDSDASMSLLRPEPKSLKVSPEDKAKRKLPAPVEPIYKEPTVRKKAEKRALPGWNCDECKNFYDELYQHDPEMLARKMDECSKHRGRNNPARPKTPDGYWNPRWSVPSDTEEFNRRNNAA